MRGEEDWLSNGATDGSHINSLAAHQVTPQRDGDATLEVRQNAAEVVVGNMVGQIEREDK
jgi:hypothetical protein